MGFIHLLSHHVDMRLRISLDPSFGVHSFTLSETRAPQFNSQKLWSDDWDSGLDSLTPVSDPMKTFYPSRMSCPGVS